MNEFLLTEIMQQLRSVQKANSQVQPCSTLVCSSNEMVSSAQHYFLLETTRTGKEIPGKTII